MGYSTVNLKVSRHERTWTSQFQHHWVTVHVGPYRTLYVHSPTSKPFKWRIISTGNMGQNWNWDDRNVIFDSLKELVEYVFLKEL